MNSIYLDQLHAAGLGTWVHFLFVPPIGHSWDEWIGNWVAALLTIALYSSLIEDNRFFKLAEHLFVGSASGYVIALTHQTVVIDKVWTPLVNTPPGTPRDLWLIIPLVLGLVTLLRLIPSLAWSTRWPIAFAAGVTLGLSLTVFVQRDLLEAVEGTIRPFQFLDEACRTFAVPIKDEGQRQLLEEASTAYSAAAPENRAAVLAALAPKIAPIVKDLKAVGLGELLIKIHRSGVPPAGSAPATVSVFHFDGIRILNALVLFVGVFCGLVYFFFSTEHRGVVGKMARLGTWFLMVSFGASFGYTIMARISLLIGRMQFLMGDWLHLKADLSGIQAGGLF